MIALPLVYGLFRGVVRMVISSLSLFFGVIFARQYASPLAGSLEEWFGNNSGVQILAYFICFAAVVFIFSMIGRVVRKGISGANLGCLDRLLGALFGCGLGLALSFGMIFSIFSYLPGPDQYLEKSRLAPGIVRTGTYFLLLIPPWMEEDIQEEYDRLRNLLDKNAKEKVIALSGTHMKERGSPSDRAYRAIFAVSSTTSAK